MIVVAHFSTSVKYSSASRTKGTRLMLVNEVALGSVHDVYKHETSLTKPPEGFDSLHGVRRQEGNDSQFEVHSFYRVSALIVSF